MGSNPGHDDVTATSANDLIFQASPSAKPTTMTSGSMERDPVKVKAVRRMTSLSWIKDQTRLSKDLDLAKALEMKVMDDFAFLQYLKSIMVSKVCKLLLKNAPKLKMNASCAVLQQLQ